MAENRDLFFLIKIGCAEHIEQFQKEGKLYLNTVEYFRNKEDDAQRKDLHEGIEEIKQIDWLRLQLGNGKKLELSRKKGDLLSGQYRSGPNGHLGNLFCMTAITNEHLERSNSIDSNLKEFGDTMLLITDTTIFINKVKSALFETNLNFEFGFVEYYDEESYEGKLGILSKSDRFEHQSEWRVFIETKEPKPFVLNLGDISNISEIIESQYLDSVKLEKVVES